ncbi:hypothetical protein BK147_16960 [Paenibacillus sp. FSL R7-0337]|nr:hypothetical protein BK147_16960 [Paenibacillus sp. FSL R7-0337]
MVIIVGSFNDYLSENDFSLMIWNRIKNLLEEDKQIHVNTILYWSLEGENLEDCFPITRYLRDIEVSI